MVTAWFSSVALPACVRSWQHPPLMYLGMGGRVADSALELINLFAGDNVHLTAAGYGKIATSIVSGIE